MPFDPSQMAASRAAGERAAERASAEEAMSVSQLAASIHSALKAGVPGTIRVTGEVSGFRDRTHWYFDLKDADAVVNCVAFANVARKSGVEVRDGMQVVVAARVDFYAKSGKVSLIVERIEPAGAGALDAKLKQLIAELRELGWLSAERKRALPRFPKRVAVVTSRSAAALQDVLDTFRRRAPNIEIVLCDTRVQGEQATAEIARTINLVSERAAALGIDAILVTRGGGSMEDLWCFNERSVAEAILRASVPVVAAIGHETDTTLAELVADERAATPTQAALRLSPDQKEMERQLEALGRRLLAGVESDLRHRGRGVDGQARDVTAALRHRLVVAQRTIAQIGGALERLSPSTRLARLVTRLEAVRKRLPVAMRGRLAHADAGPRLAQAEQGLASAMAASLTQQGAVLETLAARLGAVNPLAVLERGYSITMKPDGTIVRSSQDAPVGSELQTRLADGIVRSRVEGDRAEPLPRGTPLEARTRRKGKRGNADAGPGLFEG